MFNNAVIFVKSHQAVLGLGTIDLGYLTRCGQSAPPLPGPIHIARRCPLPLQNRYRPAGRAALRTLPIGIYRSVGQINEMPSLRTYALEL